MGPQAPSRRVEPAPHCEEEEARHDDGSSPWRNEERRCGGELPVLNVQRAVDTDDAIAFMARIGIAALLTQTAMLLRERCVERTERLAKELPPG